MTFNFKQLNLIAVAYMTYAAVTLGYWLSNNEDNHKPNDLEAKFAPRES